MNFKERGITVGDLILLFIIILTTLLTVKNFKTDKKTTLHIDNQEQLSFKRFLLSENY
tara:strand:+ start:759 stop:932 length:174 start_codon:yes stop_codon:yes gene_type:complete